MQAPVPERVADMVTRNHGADGERWLEELPAIVARVADRWDLTEFEPVLPGGAVAYVAPVTWRGTTPAVLKVSFVDDETRYEADALRAWGGHGAVRLLEHDPEDGALLLERLTPGTPLAAHPDRDEAVGIACNLLRRLWTAPRADHRFTRVADLAAGWALELPTRWAGLGGPFEEALVTHAAAQCRELATPDRPQVIANRDFHLGNVLAAERAPWLVIDPKPLAGEPAFDAGHLVLTLLPDAPSDDDADAVIGRIAGGLGQTPDRVRMWAYVRAVENALWAASTGADDPAGFVAAASALA